MLKKLRKRYKRWRKLRKPLPPSYAKLPPDIQARLASMYAWEPQVGADGGRHAMDGHTRIDPNKGCVVYDLWCATRPTTSLEVGLAYGFSTLYILGGMRAATASRHIAIDPFQTASWYGIGAQQAASVGMGERFSLIEDYSAFALPRLHAEGTRVQFAFIDGDHKFDGVLLDFTLAALLLDEGGVILFDDLWMPSIRRVARFVRRNRPDFEEVPVVARNLAAFRRIGPDERHWRHYARF